jgi:hypothetical protein
MSDPLKILFKYPSRGRVDRFFDGMDSILNNVRDKENYGILATFDWNDNKDGMADTWVENLLNRGYANFVWIYGDSKSKVDAINRDFDKIGTHFPSMKDWDIIICMSDDMRFSFYGFDDIIRLEFQQHGLDTYLHIPDQDAKAALSTLYVAGRTYFDRFGFIYNPAYESLFCDNEADDIAKILGKYRFVNFTGLVNHLNPAYGHLPKDEMFLRQQETGWTKDQKTYYDRKIKNFDL